jgi:2-polyprenyl-3-methyl-5-hydroxy-6-metoxy-1,4-benzoquinol methylase
MPNEKQFKIRTRFVGTRNVQEYRDSIAEWVNSDDVVLEIGCEWGTTTAMIARQAHEVIGTDVSVECIRRARRQHPDIRFEVLDAFDVRAALKLDKQFTKIYIDMSGISGYRSLLDVISLLTMYATVLRPKAIVVKSGALKHFASLCVPWQPREPEGEAKAPSHNRPARTDDDGGRGTKRIVRG